MLRPSRWANDLFSLHRQPRTAGGRHVVPLKAVFWKQLKLNLFKIHLQEFRLQMSLIQFIWFDHINEALNSDTREWQASFPIGVALSLVVASYCNWPIDALIRASLPAKLSLTFDFRALNLSLMTIWGPVISFDDILCKLWHLLIMQN